MKKIVIRNFSTATESFACILVGDLLSQGAGESTYKDIKIKRVTENDEQVVFKLTMVEVV